MTCKVHRLRINTLRDFGVCGSVEVLVFFVFLFRVWEFGIGLILFFGLGLGFPVLGCVTMIARPFAYTVMLRDPRTRSQRQTFLISRGLIRQEKAVFHVGQYGGYIVI